MSLVASRRWSTAAIDPAGLVEHLGNLHLAYCAAFGAPPWCEAEAESRSFLLRLMAHSMSPGFRCVVALADRDGRLLGFSYGLATDDPPQDPWARAVARALGPGFARRHLAGAFQLAELAVSPHARRHGVGGALHDAVLAAADPPRAWLVTSPLATAALALYRGRGWTVVGDLVPPASTQARLVLSRGAPAAAGRG